MIPRIREVEKGTLLTDIKIKYKGGETMGKILIGSAIVCSIITLFSIVMIPIRLEQWFEFTGIAVLGAFGTFLFLIAARLVLKDKGDNKEWR